MVTHDLKKWYFRQNWPPLCSIAAEAATVDGPFVGTVAVLKASEGGPHYGVELFLYVRIRFK